jgi:hypothetical protein
MRVALLVSRDLVYVKITRNNGKRECFCLDGRGRWIAEMLARQVITPLCTGMTRSFEGLRPALNCRVNGRILTLKTRAGRVISFARRLSASESEWTKL